MPVPDYLRSVEPLESAGKTDAEIATILNARTVTDILSGSVRSYLHTHDLWLTDPATGLRLAGAIGEAYTGLTGSQKLLVQKLHDWVYEQASIETENDDDVATLFFTILSGLVSLGIITAQQGLDIYQFGGGRPLDGIVEADIVASRNAHNTNETEIARQESIAALRAEIDNTWLNVFEADGTTDAATARAAIKAGL